MKRLIDKDALIAEIENIIADETESIKSFEHRKNVSEMQKTNARIGVLMHIRSLLDTLETKDVDLEKEIKDYFDSQPIITRSKGVDYRLIPTGVDIAKHFYELGLKARKGE